MLPREGDRLQPGGRFATVQQSIGTPRGREVGAQYLREFVQNVKARGLVAEAIARHGVRGVAVAR